MSRKIFSIDIRDNGISAFLVENTIKGNRIQTQMVVPYADINESPENKFSHIADSISQIIQDVNIAGAECIVSVPSELVSYRNLQVPFKDRKKIRQVLPFELEPTLPFAVDDLTVDFEIVYQDEKTNILVSVIKTSDISGILGILKDLNITPYIVAPAGFSSVLCLSKFSEPDTDFIFVDTDEKYSTVFAVVSGHVHIARSFCSKSANPQSVANKLYQNIMQVIAAFESSFAKDFEPSKILLSGSTADTDVLCQKMEDSLGIKIIPVDMFKDVNLKLNISSDEPFDSENMNNALSLAAVEILGIRTINFYGERSIVKKYWEEYKNDFIKTGLITAFVFVLAMFNVLFEAHFLQKEVNALNRQIAFIFQSTFPEITKFKDPFNEMKANVKQEREKNMFTGEIDEEILNIDIINEISSRIPKEQDVEITNFVRGDDSLVISGNTDTFNNVDDIKSRLENAEIIKNITISSANLEKSSNRIQFKLKIEL
jgi:type II secretory pathway component PulL